MILAYRQKTKCKQYVFKNLAETFKYFKKKCYWMETIQVIEYSDETQREIMNFRFLNQWSK